MRPDQDELDQYNLAHELADQAHLRISKIRGLIERECREALKEIGIESNTVIRRLHDGCSSADWLFEKMIADQLMDGDGKIKL